MADRDLLARTVLGWPSRYTMGLANGPCQAQQPSACRIIVLRGPDHAERQHLVRKFPVGDPRKLGDGRRFACQSEAATESDQR